ncbi:uncharacterized protein LOC125578034 [Brassica napus]|uniref:uncharacterized protein LOC125578034 n=1 Tax=Brassica napus TaxID=3708 RepID=UPI0006AB2ECE|nr:uncharacterized protein LOC125578034 [Brassica napus]
MRMIEEFKGEMAKRFEMSDLGRLTYYLGIEVKQHEEGITLSQIHYALKILEEAGMRDCNSVHILMEPGLKLAKSETKRDIDATNYKKKYYWSHLLPRKESNKLVQSKTGYTVALSSCEAEFMAGTEAARQAILLQDFLGEIIGISYEGTFIQIDNRSAISLTKNLVFHGRSKHMHSRYHFIRECVEKKLLEVEHVPGSEQKADILTKALG